MSDLFLSLEELGLRPTHRGKVREICDLGEELFIVTTDRISAFDCVLPGGLPRKGILLNQLSAFWFRGFSRLLPTHFLSMEDVDLPSRLRPHAAPLRGRWMLVRKAARLPIECVVRGYLAGSGWAEYAEKGSVAGQALPAGLREFDPLPTGPLFTPTTKEDEGHDEPLSLEEAANLIGPEVAHELERLSLFLYERASAYAATRGVVIADTKFEFGVIDGRIHLIDEVLTPDSSRFWPADSVGRGVPTAWDKQYVREYLKTLPWNRTPPAPPLPPEVAAQALSLYERAFDTLCGGGKEPVWPEETAGPRSQGGRA
jgi:phosphoribosylaminoimidazole-succinocarboxamide synthase